MKKLALVVLTLFLVGFFFNTKNESFTKEIEIVNIVVGNETQELTEIRYISINEDLKYDAITYIVYIDDAASGKNEVICPYFAPNGKPYIYDVETNTLKEVE